jgi:amino-acid N-acetyltransferase
VTAFEFATMTDADTPAVVALLEQCDLLTSGVSENLPGLLVARSNGKVIGSAGLETYGAFGLLRSIAVDRAYRGEGIAAVLVRQALERAARDHLPATAVLMSCRISAP